MDYYEVFGRAPRCPTHMYRPCPFPHSPDQTCWCKILCDGTIAYCYELRFPGVLPLANCPRYMYRPCPFPHSPDQTCWCKILCDGSIGYCYEL